MVNDTVPAAGRDGDRRSASSAVQRMPQWSTCRIELPSRHDRRDRAHWHRSRWCGIRSGVSRRVCVERYGTLTVTHQDGPGQYHVTQTITTPQFSRNLGLDPTNHHVFVAAAKFGPAPAGGRGRGPLLTDSFSVLVIGK
jgi:hypothetical protein